MAGNFQFSGRNKRTRGFKQTCIVNTTPLIDVMLVLLVIFMATAPMTTNVGINVNLPQANSGPRLNEEKDPLIVSVNEKGEIFIQNSQIEFDKIIEKLTAIIGTNKDVVVYVRGDKKLAYGSIIKVMSLIAESGIAKVSLIVEQVEEKLKS